MAYKLYYHTGSGNHGCEAIVRSTSRILNEPSILYSTDPDSERRYGVDAVVSLKHDKQNSIRKYSLRWFFAALSHKIFHDDYRFTIQKHLAFFNDIEKNDIYLSIGGDNYCYKGQEIIGYYNRKIRKMGAKTVLWGCSVEPDILADATIAKDLSCYNLITARESISFEALKKVNKNTVLVSDPAFVLDSIEMPLPANWKEGNTIGINASPLIMSSSNNSELVMSAYEKLIEGILSETQSTIALIPHVVWESNDDRTILRKLYDKYKETKRILLIEDCNCMELKGYIKRCRIFIGARTHATIAAYSSCVPTLVLGYSVKSKGIARDLFGTEENYVFSVQNLTDSGKLLEGFRWVLQHEDVIREHLLQIMPDYIKNAYKARDYLKNIQNREYYE